MYQRVSINTISKSALEVSLETASVSVHDCIRRLVTTSLAEVDSNNWPVLNIFYLSVLCDYDEWCFHGSLRWRMVLDVFSRTTDVPVCHIRVFVVLYMYFSLPVLCVLYLYL